MNLYGFANGDPINFSDPFGLIITPNGDQAKKAIEILGNGSATFRKLYHALHRSRNVNLEIRTANRDDKTDMHNASVDGGAFLRALGPNSAIMLEAKRTDAESAEILAEEIAHAAGSYGLAGVSRDCALTEECAGKIKDIIMDELKRSREAEKPREPKIQN